jgi:hypothetical protein
MTLKKQVLAILLALTLIPVFVLAQEKKTEEKNATVTKYNKESRMLTVKGKDWEQSVKVPSKVAEEKADLLKEGAKVKVELDDRGSGDIRIKSLNPR